MTLMTRNVDLETRGQRRENKRRKKRKMRIVGRSVRILQEIIRQRTQKCSVQTNKLTTLNLCSSF